MTDNLNYHLASCRCGFVRLKANGQPLTTGACHCEGCRRMSAGPYSLGAIYADEAVTIVSGKTSPIGADPYAGHQGCPHCASWVISRPPVLVDMVVVRSALFEDAAAFAPFVETFTSEKLPFVSLIAPHRFERFPNPSEFPTLMSEYAKWVHAVPSARPPVD
ncbi:GFA family protein [Neorhizobium sp. DAR64861/K0K2]|uniref:GFA family protein n=1 Tax=unclassified Neorhizobium TaxID=2629175 RepID=UPI003D294A25